MLIAPANTYNDDAINTIDAPKPGSSFTFCRLLTDCPSITNIANIVIVLCNNCTQLNFAILLKAPANTVIAIEMPIMAVMLLITLLNSFGLSFSLYFKAAIKPANKEPKAATDGNNLLGSMNDNIATAPANKITETDIFFNISAFKSFW